MFSRVKSMAWAGWFVAVFLVTTAATSFAADLEPNVNRKGMNYRRIVLPVLAPAILAGGLLAFTLSVDEFIIAFFTAGAGRASTTLPMQIYAMIRFGVTPEINALATLVLGVSVTALALAQRLNKGALPGQ